MKITKCVKCKKNYQPEDIFCDSYPEYCYECGEAKAYKDYHEFEKRQFEAELEREDPDFSDFWNIADDYI